MRVKKFSALVLGMVGLAASSVAKAEDAPAAVPAAPTDPAATPPTATAAGPAATGAAASKMRIGLTLVPMPMGSLKTNALGPETSTDSAFAFGVMPVFDYLVLPNFFVGFAPSYAFNVKGKDSMGDAAKELDIMLRLGGGVSVAEKIGVYGYAAPGYSVVSPPQGDSAKGLILGLHAGGMMDIASNLFVNAELGYQLGFQKFSLGGTDVDTKTNFFQIGLGIGMHL